MMKFMKNLLRRLTTVVVGISLVALLVVSYANAVQAGTLDNDGEVVGESNDISGIERNQKQVHETNKLNPNSSVDDQFYQDRNLEASDGKFPRDRDIRAYDENASLGEKFGDTLENAKKTFEEATKSVSENSLN